MAARAPTPPSDLCAPPNRATQRAPDDVDDLIDIAIRVTLLGGGSNAPLDVILQHENRQRIHGGPEGGRLLQDVHAILLALDHPGDTAYLALDSRESADELGLVLGVAMAKRVASHHVAIGGFLCRGHVSSVHAL